MSVALAERAGRVRTSYLMQEFQRIVVASSDSIVMADSGNAFAWGNQCLSFRDAGRYRVSVGYGSMGHFTAGALGAALASGRRTVALVGDGAMLMNNEINTAVQYGAPAVWVVLNDGRYGMVEQGMRALGYQPVEAEFPEVDFVAVARAMGADGVHAREESEVGAALKWALSADGPVVVDVSIDGNEPSPVLMRVKSLIRQGAAALPRNVG
jgi:acetolactate synthase-1/2/3 large subunit